MISRRYIVVIALLLPMMAVSAKKPQPKAALSTEQEQQFTYYWYAARHAIDQERYPEAYTLLHFCRALKPDDAQTLYYLAVMHSGLKQADQAKACLEQAYAVSPKGTAPDELLERLRSLYISEKAWKKALAIQDELEKRNGYDALSAVTRYRIYAMADQPKRAIRAIDRYLETDPGNLRFLLFRIELMEQTGAKPKEMYAAFEQVLEADPYNLMVLNNYAWMLATHRGDLNKAEQMSAITIREAPNDPTFLDTYGWIMHLKGEDQLALFYLNRAYWNARDERHKAEIERHLKEVKNEK